MTNGRPAGVTMYRTRIRWPRVAGLLVVVAAVGAVLGGQLPGSSSSTATAPAASRISVPHGELGPPDAPTGALGEADGAVPAGATVFDGAIPGVAKLAPALLGALRQA